MEQFLHFLLTYQDQVFLAMFATLAFVALVNFVHNAYARQNFALKRFNKRTLHSPSSIVWETRQLPMDYQRQWRAFVNSGCAKPSVVFEFVKRPQRYLLWFAHFVAFVVCVAYFVLAIALDDQEIFAYIRKNGEEQLLVVCNFSAKQRDFCLPEEFLSQG